MNIHPEQIRRATEHLNLGKPGEAMPRENKKEPFKLDWQSFHIWKAYEVCNAKN